MSTPSPLLLALALLSTLAADATPLPLMPGGAPPTRIAYAPPVLAPAAGAVWRAGERHAVRWDASRMPRAAHNVTGLVLLGHRDAGAGRGADEHLDIRACPPCPARGHRR
jgi:hypothetical protein